MGLLFDLEGAKQFFRQHCKRFRKLSDTLFDLDALFSHHSYNLCTHATFIETSVFTRPGVAPVLTRSSMWQKWTLVQEGDLESQCLPGDN